MATLVDAVGLLQKLGFYDTVFPFILIFAGVYAMLTKYKPFGEMKAMNGLIAFVIAMFFISMVRAVAFVRALMPTITIFLVMIVVALLIFTFMGIQGETITKVLTEETAGWATILLIFIIIILSVVSQVFPEASISLQNPVLAQQLNISSTPGSNATSSEQAGAFLFAQTMSIIFSPMVLGMIIMLLVFGIAIYFITREPEK
jgi:hypothetical protein